MSKAVQLSVTTPYGLVLLLTAFHIGCGGNGGSAAQPPPTIDAGSSDVDAAVPTIDAGAGEPDAATAPPLRPIDRVDPFIGTDDSSSPNPVPGGAGGSTYPG